MLHSKRFLKISLFFFKNKKNFFSDPCYHLECDDLININQECYAVTSQAAAYVVQKYATADNIDTLLQ